MIPTLILAGLLIGRWWAVPAAAVAWPALLLIVGALDLSSVPAAAAFAILNTAVGVFPRWVFREMARSAKRSARPI